MTPLPQTARTNTRNVSYLGSLMASFTLLFVRNLITATAQNMHRVLTNSSPKTADLLPLYTRRTDKRSFASPGAPPSLASLAYTPAVPGLTEEVSESLSISRHAALTALTTLTTLTLPCNAKYIPQLTTDSSPRSSTIIRQSRGKPKP